MGNGAPATGVPRGHIPRRPHSHRRYRTDGEDVLRSVRTADHDLDDLLDLDLADDFYRNFLLNRDDPLDRYFLDNGFLDGGALPAGGQRDRADAPQNTSLDQPSTANRFPNGHVRTLPWMRVDAFRANTKRAPTGTTAHNF